MKILVKLVINVVALLFVEYLIPGFKFESLTAIVVASIVIAIVNTFIKPILQLIALPISILTFGIFAFIINVGLLFGISYIVPGFYIDGFVTAIIASILLSLVSWFLNKLIKD